MKSDLVDVEVVLFLDRPLAIGVRKDEQFSDAQGKAIPLIWLPKSQIEIECGAGSVVTVTLPESLAIEKGLV